MASSRSRDSVSPATGHSFSASAAIGASLTASRRPQRNASVLASTATPFSRRASWMAPREAASSFLVWRSREQNIGHRLVAEQRAAYFCASIEIARCGPARSSNRATQRRRRKRKVRRAGEVGRQSFHAAGTTLVARAHHAQHLARPATTRSTPTTRSAPADEARIALMSAECREMRTCNRDRPALFARGQTCR